MWVDSEYAGELAVLSAWLSALVPWNVTYAGDGPLGSTLVLVRSGILELHLVLGLSRVAEVNGERVRLKNIDQILDSVGVLGVPLVDSIYVSNPVVSGVASSRLATLVAGVGGAAILAAVALSVVMYVAEQRTEGGPVDPVRVMGGLLGVATVAFAAATVLYYRSPVPGVPVPVGVVILGLFSWTLLTVDRTDRDTSDAGEGEPDPDGA